MSECIDIKGIKLFKKEISAIKCGFTLAEMMIVMLILAIVMAAFAPVMTRKSKVDMSSPWKWVEGTSDIRFATGEAGQIALIGKLSKPEGVSGRLLINTKSTDAKAINHLVFEDNSTSTGVLRTSEKSVLLGSIKDDEHSTTALAEDSVAIGHGIKSAEKSVAIGTDVMAKNTSGKNNVGIGYFTLSENTTGWDNTAVGYNSLSANTTGNGNTALGYGTLKSNSSGNYNIAIGYEALFNHTAGVGNIGIGVLALKSNSAGQFNTASGYHAMEENTSGNYNSVVGTDALRYNTTGSYNVAIGYRSLLNNKVAACSSDTSDATCPVNVGIGSYSLQANTSGFSNTAVGHKSLYSNTTGKYNTVVGSQALYTNSEGEYNTALGYGALRSNTASDDNTAIGSGALASNSTGNRNTATGNNALFSNSEGNNNTAIGYQACLNVKGSNKTCLGASSGPTSATDTSTEEIWIGTDSGTVYVPGTLIVAGSQVTSDKRLKNILSANEDGLSKVRQLKVYNFTMKNDKKKEPKVGVIAQDLKKIFPNAVFVGEDGYLRIRWDEMFYAMVNAIKEIAVKLDSHDKKIQQLELENKQLKLQNVKLEQRLEVLEKKLMSE